MLVLLVISAFCVEKPVYGAFDPLAVPSSHVQGPYTNWRVKGIDSFSEVTWNIPEGCAKISPDGSDTVFSCPKTGSYTVTSLEETSRESLSFEFAVGQIGTEYIWYIVLDEASGPESSGFCGKTSLCYSKESVHVKCWVVPARASDAYPMNEDEFNHLLSEPSENAALVTRRFHALGEFPLLNYGTANDITEFIFNTEKNYWEADIQIDPRFPEKFVVKGHEVSDFFGSILDLSGEFYAVPVEIQFDKLFQDETGTFTDGPSVVELCACHWNIGAMVVSGSAFVTMSAFESAKRVKLANINENLVSLGFSLSSVIAATENAVYCGQKGVWTKIHSAGARVVRTISLCCTAPTLEGTMSRENDMLGFLVGDNDIYFMKTPESTPVLIQEIKDITTKVHDFRFNSQTLLAVVDLKDPKEIGYVLYDIKLGTIHVFNDSQGSLGTAPKVQFMDNGGIFIYGSRLIYSLDLTIWREMKIPDWVADEEITSLVCSNEVFAFVSNKQKLYYGTLIDQTMVNLWAPSTAKNLNLFFKGDLLYCVYYDTTSRSVMTKYMYTVRKSFDDITTFCVDCPEVGDYVFLDLYERLEFGYSIASFHNDSLMASVQSPSFAKVTNAYSESSYACGQLVRYINSDEASVLIEPHASCTCELFNLNVTIQPMDTSGRTVAEVLEQGNGNGIVRFVLSEPELIHYMHHFGVSIGCRPTSYLRLVYKGSECKSVDEAGNEVECEFQVLYGRTQFRPQIFLEDGISSHEITEDFAFLPDPTNADNGYRFTMTAGTAKCTRKPQSFAEMGTNWSKLTYEDCFSGVSSDFDTDMQYEIMNSTHNAINFHGEASEYKFRLVLLGFHDTYCLHTVNVKAVVRNRAMKAWEIAIAVVIAFLAVVNLAIIIFWRSFAYAFCEFYIEHVRMGREYDEYEQKPKKEKHPKTKRKAGAQYQQLD